MLYGLGEESVVTEGDYYVAPNACVIGAVRLKDKASVWFNCVVRGDNDQITIGERTNVQDGSILHVDEGVPLTLGDDVSIGHMAMLHGCTVGEGSLIGINAVVLNHTVIGKHCLIGAKTLIAERKTIPDRSLVLGAPGRVVRLLTDEEVANIGEIARHYVDKAVRYREGLQPLSGGPLSGEG